MLVMLDLKEVDMDLEIPEEESELVDTRIASGVGEATGEETQLGSKTYLKSPAAIDSFNSPTQVSTKIPASTVLIVSALGTLTNSIIPLNTKAFEAIRNTQEVLVFQNTHPKSTGAVVTFVSITICHKVHGANPGATVYSSIKWSFELLLKADPSTSIQALYEDKNGPTLLTAPIEAMRDLPLDVMGLFNYVQVSNAYTLSPAFGKDGEGNNKLQYPTWVFLRVKIKYPFSHLVGLIQHSLNILNVSMREKEMLYLDMKMLFALVGTTNEWCPVALQHTIKEALGKHLESMKKEGLLCGE
jgi:hypothetical protein